MVFFFNDTATTEIYTLSLHDALPISRGHQRDPPPTRSPGRRVLVVVAVRRDRTARALVGCWARHARSEEHTSELQSRQYLVCRLLLEKKKKHRPHDVAVRVTHHRQSY